MGVCSDGLVVGPALALDHGHWTYSWSEFRPLMLFGFMAIGTISTDHRSDFCHDCLGIISDELASSPSKAVEFSNFAPLAFDSTIFSASDFTYNSCGCHVEDDRRSRRSLQSAIIPDTN